MDVYTRGDQDNGAPCGKAFDSARWEKCGAFCFRCHERNPGGDKPKGEAHPQSKMWRVDLGQIDRALMVAADVRIVDVHAIVERLKPIARKDTSGRKRGWLDVNEYTLEGADHETVYCERLARKLGGGAAGPYVTRRRLPCDDLPATPVQRYTLYRAQRDVTIAVQTVYEWFPKIRKDSDAYASRSSIGSGGTYSGLYSIKLDADETGVYVSGEIAASLAPQTIAIAVDWRTRPL
jgi:hypothetical protein